MISKRHWARMMAVGAIVGLAACAAGGARESADLALRNGDYLGAFRALRTDLATPGEARQRAVRQLADGTATHERLVAGFTKSIQEIDGLNRFGQLNAELTLASASGVLTSEQVSGLSQQLQLTLSKKVADGVILLHLDEVVEAYPTLVAMPEVKRRLVENTLQVIQAGAPGSAGVRRPPVTALFQFLATAGSDYRDLARGALSRMDFSIRELKFDVHPVFPSYAEQRLDELITDVAIVGSTRLLEVDVGGILTKREEFAITEDEKNADAVVQIAELQYRERQIGPVQRPVRIAAQFITPLFRPAGVPEGSVFVYDLVESTFDVEWVYETRIVRHESLSARDVIRGTETRTDHQCHNGRYVTTSGQEIPSSDWPTADLSLSCRGSGPPATAGLQPAIMQKLGEQVLKRLENMEPTDLR